MTGGGIFKLIALASVASCNSWSAIHHQPWLAIFFSILTLPIIFSIFGDSCLSIWDMSGSYDDRESAFDGHFFIFTTNWQSTYNVCLRVASRVVEEEKINNFTGFLLHVHWWGIWRFLLAKMNENKYWKVLQGGLIGGLGLRASQSMILDHISSSTHKSQLYFAQNLATDQENPNEHRKRYQLLNSRKKTKQCRHVFRIIKHAKHLRRFLAKKPMD